MSSIPWPDYASDRTAKKQSNHPSSGFEKALTEKTEVQVFKQFQSSSAIQEILPGCEVQTEYEDERLSWKVTSAEYLNSILIAQGGSSEGYRGFQSWSDVVKLIQDAEEEYLEKGKGSWIRRKMRNGQDVAAVLQSLTDMIPEEQGLGVLRGGLSLLFTVWRDRIKNREKVFTALSDIPTILCVALQKWKFFQRDEQLRNATKQLLDSSIDAIRSLIEILLPNNTSRMSNWKQKLINSLPEREGRMIEQILAAVNTAMKNVDTNIDRLDRARDAETHFYARNADNKTDTMQKELSELINEIAGLKKEVQKTMMGGIPLIPQHMAYLQIPMVEIFQTDFYNLVTEEPYKRSLQPPPAIALPGPSVHIYTVSLSGEQILGLLAIHSHDPYQDRDTVLLKGHTMSPVSLGRGRYLLETPEFRELLSAPYPGLLLVDGGSQNESDGKVSPISVFCASLAATLAHNPAIMVLHFFAGQHSFPDDDPVRGPRGLIRSLIYQVLLYPNQGSPGLDRVTEQAVQDVADGDIDALCWLFIELLKRVLNVTAVICIVDNVADFETKYEGWVDELMRVFDWLRKVPAELKQGLNFKLLMTSARKSTELVYKTDPSEHLSLVAGNVMNVGKSEWAMTEDIGNSVPPQDRYWHEDPGYS